MNRRTLLRAATVGGVGLLAGCLGGGTLPGDDPSASPSDSDSPTTTGDSTDTRSPTATGEKRPSPSATGTHTPPNSPPEHDPALSSTDFEVVSNECGQGRNRADAHADAPTVTVTGVIDGSDACYTARLADASLDRSGTTLRMDVESYVPESDETPVCGQCIVDIEYESTFEFEGGLPDEAVVRHDGEQVAEIPLSG